MATAIVAGAALLLGGIGGCSHSGSAAPEVSESPNAAKPTLAASAGDLPAAQRWMVRPDLPFDYYSDLIDQVYLRESDLADAGDSDWESKQEEFIAACMKDEGFAYYPRSVEQPTEEGKSVMQVGDRKLWLPSLPDNLADVQRYGYGYLEAAPPTDNLAGAATDGEADPNGDYVASLSATAQREYNVALLGAEMAEYDLLADLERIPLPELGGCMGEASKAHPYPLAEVMDDSPATQYGELIDQMSRQGGSPYDPQFLTRGGLDALDVEWGLCWQREYFNGAPPPGLPSPGSTAETPSELNGPTGALEIAINTNANGEYWNGPDGEAPAQYSSLTGTVEEIRIAVADFKCRQETDYVNRFLALEREAQERFIAAHKAELDQMVAAFEQYINV